MTMSVLRCAACWSSVSAVMLIVSRAASTSECPLTRVATISMAIRGEKSVSYQQKIAAHLRKLGGSYDLMLMFDREQPKPPWAGACRTR